MANSPIVSRAAILAERISRFPLGRFLATTFAVVTGAAAAALCLMPLVGITSADFAIDRLADTVIAITAIVVWASLFGFGMFITALCVVDAN